MNQNNKWSLEDVGTAALIIILLILSLFAYQNVDSGNALNITDSLHSTTCNSPCDFYTKHKKFYIYNVGVGVVSYLGCSISQSGRFKKLDPAHRSEECLGPTGITIRNEHSTAPAYANNTTIISLYPLQ